MKTLLLAITFIICLQTIYTCSCIAPEKDLSIAFGMYTNIFKGTVVDVNDISATQSTQKTDPNALPTTLDSIHITFNQITSFKGTNKDTTTYTTASNSAACGYNFVVGQTYIVYANANSSTDNPSISLCSHTKLYTNDDNSKNEITQLQALSGMNVVGSSGFNLVSKLFVALFTFSIILM